MSRTTRLSRRKPNQLRPRVSRFDSLEDRRLLALLVGLTEDNSILIFDSATPGNAVERDITGVQNDADIIGIDVRPANGELYGVSNDSRIYIIEPTTGAATLVSTLSTPLPDADAFGVDFNPVPDRLRITSTDGTNYRVNVDTGAVIVDGPLSYAPGDVNAGDTPEVAGSAYTNSVAGATTTTLYGIDTDNDILVTQNPPNNGTLNTIGSLGVDADEEWVGFDIINPGTAFAALEVDGDTNLYSVNLTTGAATFIGEIGDGEELLGLAADPTAGAPTTPPNGNPNPNPTPGQTSNLNFVMNLYDDVLNRPGDQGGVAYWAGLLDSGNLTREEVAQNFLASPEYVLNLIQTFYTTFLGRTAQATFDPATNQFIGPEAYFFNKYYGDDEEDDADDRIDDADREEDIIREIVTSQEYALLNGLLADGVINAADSIPYVTALYRDILGRAPDAGGLAGFVQALNSGASPASVVDQFLHSTELHINLLTDQFGVLPYMEDWNDDYFDGLGPTNDPFAQAIFQDLEDGDTWREVQARILALEAYFAASQTLTMT